MTTFDPADVRRFAISLDDRMNQCDNSEGMECANLDQTLSRYARICCEFREQCRQWGRAVFSGKVAFDPEVERIWIEEGHELLERARELWGYGQELNGECFVIESGAALGSSLWFLERLLYGWVTPKLAVAPLARQGLGFDPANRKEIQSRINALQPLPADWRPTDPRQQMRLKKLSRQRDS